MKILLIQTAFPGDAVLTLPLIQEAQKKYPSSKIDVLCIPSTSILFQASPYVNSVIEFDKKEKHKGFVSLFKLIFKIRSQHYDYIFSPHRSARSSVISYFSSAKKTISFDKSALSFLYDKRVQYRKDWHEVQRNLALLDSEFAEDNWKILPEVNIKPEQKKDVDNLLSQVDYSKLIAIAPGSVWETKKYPIEHYKDLAHKLVEKEYTIVILGGKEDFDLGEKLREGNSRILNFCGKLDFIQSIYLLTITDLLISNDSAPTHLGMCADIPVLTIYCSTVPQFGFYPYNNKSDYISLDDLYCKPCGIHGFQKCPEKHFDCGLKQEPDNVLLKALSLIG